MKQVVNKVPSLRLRFLFFLLLGYVSYAMLRLSMGVMLPEIVNEFDLVELQSGAFISSSFAGMIVTLGVAGYLSDRLGRTIAATAGLSLLSIGVLLTGYSNSYLNATVSVFIAGLGAGVFVPSAYAALGEALPRSRGFLVGVANGCYALGGFLGPWLTGIILPYFGWRIPFIIFGLLEGLIGVGLWFSGLRKSPEAMTSRKRVRRISEMLRTRTVLVASAALLSANVGFASFISWAPTFLLSVDELNITQTGFAVGIGALTGGAGSMALGWLSDRWSRKAVNFASGIWAAVLAYFYFGRVNSFFVIAGLSAVFGFAAYAYYSLIISLAQDSVQPAAIGSATGFILNISIAGSIIAPVMAASLMSFIGVRWGMVCSVSIPYLVQAILVLAPTERSDMSRENVSY
jgi:MFS family permease